MATVSVMAAIPTISRPSTSLRGLTTVGVVAGTVIALLFGGCSSEQAVPIDPANPPVLDVEPPDVSHPIGPTPQMEQLARQQCVDDPTLDQGYVEAVDPTTDEVMTEITVDCDEVRAGS